MKNLTLSLINRERFGNRSAIQDINAFLEKKTAQNNSVQLSYHQHQEARSTFLIAFSPDRTKIATTHGNHTVKVSDCYTCKVIHTLHGHVRTPWCVAFHPRLNNILASGCLGGQVRLWDLNDLYRANFIHSSQSVIASLVFHPVEDIILIGTTNKITFLKWNEGVSLKTVVTKHHTESIRLLKFLPYGDKLITGIANASTQYCKPTSLNVSTRGDPLSGQPVVQTVSCLRMHKRQQEDNRARTSSTAISKQSKLVQKGLKVSIPLKKLQNAPNEQSANAQRTRSSDDRTVLSSNEKAATSSDSMSYLHTTEENIQTDPPPRENTTPQSGNLFTQVERSSERQRVFHRRQFNPSSSPTSNNSHEEEGEEGSSSQADNTNRGQISNAGFDDLDISVESSSTTIPGQGFFIFPSVEGFGHSASVSNLNRFRTQTAVATATARSSHHVHTAVVIASQEERQSEMALQTAVNRAIAGAFAGSGEGAVANNIIDTTHRLQLWDFNSGGLDLHDEEKNVIVPFCKIHNDSSVDVSHDGSLVSVFVPNEKGFPMDAELQVISLKSESYLHCIFSRKFGPNAISISLSPLNRFVAVGLASRKLHWHVTSHQLVAQILELPAEGQEIFDDSTKAVSHILHMRSQTLRSNVSVNTVRFHPSPGMGIIYGTNRGHIQHCHVGYLLPSHMNSSYLLPSHMNSRVQELTLVIKIPGKLEYEDNIPLQCDGEYCGKCQNTGSRPKITVWFLTLSLLFVFNIKMMLGRK